METVSTLTDSILLLACRTEVVGGVWCDGTYQADEAVIAEDMA